MHCKPHVHRKYKQSAVSTVQCLIGWLKYTNHKYSMNRAPNRVNPTHIYRNERVWSEGKLKFESLFLMSMSPFAKRKWFRVYSRKNETHAHWKNVWNSLFERNNFNLLSVNFSTILMHVHHSVSLQKHNCYRIPSSLIQHFMTFFFSFIIFCFFRFVVAFKLKAQTVACGSIVELNGHWNSNLQPY